MTTTNKTKPIFTTTVSRNSFYDYRDERYCQYYDGVCLCEEWIKRVFSFIYGEEDEESAPLSFTINVYKTRKKGTFPVRFLKESNNELRQYNICLYPKVSNIEINVSCWKIAKKLGLIEKTVYVEFTDVKWD